MLAVTDASGNVKERYAYDPWGLRKNPADWSQLDNRKSFLFSRGYTLHEHLDDYGLINMNGRVYDPLMAQFLSPDPYIQAPGSWLNYNRYAYCYNNPLVYTDPSGEFFIPMLIGAAISVITNGVTNVVNDRSFFDGAGTAALIGGIGGAFSFGIGQAAQGMSGFGQVAFQTSAHGYLGGMMSGLNGNSYGSGFLSGAFGSLAATGTGILLQNAGKGTQALGIVGSGAISGGVGAEIAGGDFWDGFRNGAISSGLNHGIHSGLLGEGLMMSSITGRTRHLFGPDAIAIAGTGDVSSGVSVGIEKGGIVVLRGNERGIYSLNDVGIGIGGITVSAGAEVMRLYSSAGKVLRSHFYGNRYEGNLSVTIFDVSVGVTGTLSRHSDGYTVGLGHTIGLDAMPFNIGFNVNKGVTTQYFHQLNSIKNAFNTWW